MNSRWICALFASAVLSAPSIRAQDTAAPPKEEKFLTGSVGLGVSSGQTYRGERLTEEGTATLTPSLSVTFGGLVTVSASPTFDTQEQTATRRVGGKVQSETKKFSQQVFGLTLEKDTKVADLSLTGTYTRLPESDDNSQAGGLSAVFHVPASPGLSITREGGSTVGWFFAPSLNPSFKLGEKWRVQLVASASYSYGSTIESRAVRFSSGFVPERGTTGTQEQADSYSGWSDANASATIVYTTGALSISLGGAYSTILDGEVQRRLGEEDQPKGTFTGTLSLGYSF